MLQSLQIMLKSLLHSDNAQLYLDLMNFFSLCSLFKLKWAKVAIWAKCAVLTPAVY